jgi:hypothetical protein
MIRRLIVTILTLSMLLFWFSSGSIAAPESRVALVIGNGAYIATRALHNSVSDARAIAENLRGLAFDVVDGYDLTTEQTADILRTFSERLAGAEVALFFYAGHGIQVNNQNFLLPVDTELESELDLQFEAIPIDLVLNHMQTEPRVNLVFLDACRDNPLTQSLVRSIGSTRSTAIGEGLAPLEAGDGTLIAYATEPGDVALDGEGPHSPFTTALLKHIASPGLVVESMLNRVKRDVRETTANQQRPWVHSSLAGDFFMQPAVHTVYSEESIPPSALPPSAEILFWDSIRNSRSSEDFQAYLSQYPTGIFAALALNRLRDLQGDGDSVGTQESYAQEPGLAELNDEDLWQSIRDSDDASAFQTYVDRFPEGAHADAARNRVEALNRWEQKQKELSGRQMAAAIGPMPGVDSAPPGLAPVKLPPVGSAAPEPAKAGETYMLIRPPDDTAILNIMDVVAHLPGASARFPVERLTSASNEERARTTAMFDALARQPSPEAMGAFLAAEVVEHDEPVEEWQQVRSFTSKARCETTKVELQNVTKLHSQRMKDRQDLLVSDFQFHLLAASFAMSECVPASSLPTFAAR